MKFKWDLFEAEMHVFETVHELAKGWGLNAKWHSVESVKRVAGICAQYPDLPPMVIAEDYLKAYRREFDARQNAEGETDRPTA